MDSHFSYLGEDPSTWRLSLSLICSTQQSTWLTCPSKSLYLKLTSRFMQNKITSTFNLFYYSRLSNLWRPYVKFCSLLWMTWKKHSCIPWSYWLCIWAELNATDCWDGGLCKFDFTATALQPLMCLLLIYNLVQVQVYCHNGCGLCTMLTHQGNLYSAVCRLWAKGDDNAWAGRRRETLSHRVLCCAHE